MRNTLVIAGSTILALIVAMTLVAYPNKELETTFTSSQSTHLAASYRDETCTDQRAAECAVFVAEIIDSCVTAMAAGGADIIADIRCAKARKLITSKKDCIPCLCE
jgi:hypothetical protein